MHSTFLFMHFLRRFAKPNKPNADAISGNAAGTGTSDTLGGGTATGPEPTLINDWSVP